MSYMTAQALLKTLLLTNSNFGANDVTEADLRILDRGITNGAVLFPAGLPTFDLAGMVREHEYEALIDLYVKFTGDDAYNALGTLRDSVIATLDTAKCLGDTYFMMALASDGDPIEVFDSQNRGPFFIWQRLRLTINEQV